MVVSIYSDQEVTTVQLQNNQSIVNA